MSGRGSENVHWTAFQYISAEMSAEDQARFEQQLADDPVACQAVADAVELAVTAAAAAVPVQRPARAVSTRSSGRRAVGWTSSLAGVLLLATLAGWAVLRDRGFIAEQAAPDHAPIGPELAIIWSQTTPPPAEAAWDVERPVPANRLAALDTWDSDEAESPPDWVLSAVVAEAHGGLVDDLSEPEGL